MNSVRRVYVEKKEEFAIKAAELLSEIHGYLDIPQVENVRVLVRYDVENVPDDVYQKALGLVFSEPPVDYIYEETFPMAEDEITFSVEYLPGQFDQRADSAEQCLKLLHKESDAIIRSATTYVLRGSISDDQLASIKSYCINPVDSRETGLDKPDTLVQVFDEPEDVIIFDGFQTMSDDALRELYDSLGLAMTFADFLHIRNYFLNEEHRDPTMTEIRVLDTYWSDHCRHTTFSTELTDITFEDGYYKDALEGAFKEYKAAHEELYRGRNDKFICLMDLALLAAKQLKKAGKLDDQEESEEINACSIIVPLVVDGKEEEWLVNFKNETHNHPTEIEPFGGAATCLGGAIRDPLSGRTYVYQAMRVTGAADPTVSVKDTLPGKLPQIKIVRSAAEGYSSYGNQIGLATGLVKEIYHPDYVAKRMEIGAVIAAAPRRAVQRLSPAPGDVIILLGGRTGRDGCGGATGSSKAHTTESIDTCGAEVQKGNPPTERKIQRLFRREEAAYLIKKCNDFGAGGVSVAIGELADGLQIDLDKVPKKYAGLDGTELAISESQERMAVVVAPEDVNTFMQYASEENLEAVEVAVVTESPRLVLNWRGKEIVNLSRAFLDTNGAHQETSVIVDVPDEENCWLYKYAIPAVKEDLEAKKPHIAWLDTMRDLNVCSQKGLVERFDASIGAGSVFMPYGGKYQLTETQTMIAKIPVENGESDSVTMMSYGFDPYLSSWSPYHGAAYAVVESVAKIVASGGDFRKIRFSFQEYFRRMTSDPHRWSQPFTALLGAYKAQLGLGLPSIGGKDSMSGSFNEIDVPPTLVSFAVDVANANDIITPEFKDGGNRILRFSIARDEYDMPDFEQICRLYDAFHEVSGKKLILSAYAVDGKGVVAAVTKMALGNQFGVKLPDVTDEEAFLPAFGDIVAEVREADVSDVMKYMREADLGEYVKLIGRVTSDSMFSYHGHILTTEEITDAWTGTLENVYPTRSANDRNEQEAVLFEEKNIYVCKNKVAKPKVFIPVMPGTNCEYDSAKAFIEAGADVSVKVFRNLTPQDIEESVEIFDAAIRDAQIIMFPGGFSAGDEPEGSAKFFATAFRNEKIKEAVQDLVSNRDGLCLGICNGFQTLIKLGLVPYGEICEVSPADAPTLTYNRIGRHISKMANIRVVSNKSPWLQEAELGGIYVNPASHGEGRFVASDEWLKKLAENGQIATQYVNEAGNPTTDEEWNINASYGSIEGITSPDGRIYGKMCHSERRGTHVAINIYGEQNMKLFQSGVNYFL